MRRERNKAEFSAQVFPSFTLAAGSPHRFEGSQYRNSCPICFAPAWCFCVSDKGHPLRAAVHKGRSEPVRIREPRARRGDALRGPHGGTEVRP